MLALLATASPVDATELIRAGRSETILRDAGVLRIEAGGVTYRHTGRALSVSADSARLWIPDGGLSRARFFGRVTYRDSARTLAADALTYHPRSELASFRGGVRVIEQDRLLDARRVTFRKKANLLEAEGAVKLNYSRKRISFHAPAMTYHVLADSGLGSGGVQAVRLPETPGDSLYVRSDSMHFADLGDRMRFSGRVRMEHAGIRAHASRGRYFRPADRLELGGGASAVWIRNHATTADSVTLNAERMRVYGAGGSTLDRIVLIGAARLHKESGQPEIEGGHEVRADSVVLGMSEGRIVAIDASGGASATLTTSDGAGVDLKGGRICMDLPEGNLDSLTVLGMGTGAYVSSDSTSVSRISGGSIAIGLEDGAVREVLITESARCTHRSETGKTGNIRLSGDSVKLTFDRDGLSDVHAEGGVRGRYKPAESGDAP
ncbi:MAG: hypothetical protein OXU79_05865 [Gemmatimonadota bacterium]|nr:hypothetical protein [Gemmatimonadota bacterium]